MPTAKIVLGRMDKFNQQGLPEPTWAGTAQANAANAAGTTVDDNVEQSTISNNEPTGNSGETFSEAGTGASTPSSIVVEPMKLSFGLGGGGDGVVPPTTSNAEMPNEVLLDAEESASTPSPAITLLDTAAVKAIRSGKFLTIASAMRTRSIVVIKKKTYDFESKHQLQLVPTYILHVC